MNIVGYFWIFEAEIHMPFSNKFNYQQLYQNLKMAIKYDQLLFLIYLCTSLSLSMPEANYTYYSSYQTQEDNVHILQSTADNQYIIITGFTSHGKKQVQVYDILTWKLKQENSTLIIDSFLTIFFLNHQHQSCALYYSRNNQLVLRIYSQSYSSYEDQIMYNFIDRKIANIDISSDKTMWALSHKTEGIYYGKLTESGSAVNVFPVNGTYQNLAWRPNTKQLVFSNSPNQLGQERQLYLFNTQTLQYERMIEGNGITNLFFLNTDKLLMSTYTRQSKQQCWVTLHNLTTGESTSQYFGRDQCQIFQEGGIVKLIIFDKKQLYFFGNQQFFTNQSYFYINDIAHGEGGLIWLNSGAVLYIIAPDHPVTIEMYKLCNQVGYYYNQLQFQCQICHQSCQECIYRADTCLSCVDETYLYDEVKHSCYKPEQNGKQWIFVLVGCLILVVVIGGLIFVIRRRNQQNKQMRASVLSENQQILEDYSSIK